MRLKSDQNGIERISKFHCTHARSFVEIRPKWDWKHVLYPHYPLQQRCWNQTKMGLKGSAKSIMHYNGIAGWNQTKMGLKA